MHDTQRKREVEREETPGQMGKTVDGYLQWAQSRSTDRTNMQLGFRFCDSSEHTGFFGAVQPFSRTAHLNTWLSGVCCGVMGCLVTSVLAPRPLVRAFLCV